MLLKRIIIVVLFGAGSLAIAANAPERRVESNVIISERDPKVRIELPKSVQYVGADRWVLYGIADCELHAFVEADNQQNVQRLYWVQFERYLTSKPDLHHKYDSPRHATIGGLDFCVDTWVKLTNDKIRPGSDEEHILALIRAHGYKMPAGMMYVRLVHLLDEQKRKELMFIYSEDLAPTAFTAAEIQASQSARSSSAVAGNPKSAFPLKVYDQWPGIEKGLLERTEKKIKIR